VFVCSECGHAGDVAGHCPDDGQPLHASDDPLLGTEVGRYRLARTLGEGGMGKVYLGVQRAIGSRVAIKVLSEQCSKNAELVERFFAEARAVNLIRHEHIVAVIDMDLLRNGRPYIVMEYVEGPTLAHLVRNTQAPLGGIVEVVGEILSALAAAHAIGIVHRDLKPDNVLITAEGHAKVLDFGIAKLAPGIQGTSSPRTATGALLGTPAYMAPEQITGGHVDARADVYAAGILLYECVTGRPPFSGETLYDLMNAHVEKPAPVARDLRPSLPVELEHIIMIALAKDPAKRFQNAAAMATALEAATAAIPDAEWRSLTAHAAISRRRLSDSPLQTPVAPSVYVPPTLPARTPTAVPTPAPAAPPRQHLAIAMGALGVAGAGVAIAMIALRDDPPPQPAPPSQLVLAVTPDAAPITVPVAEEVTLVTPDAGPAPRRAKAPGDAAPSRAPQSIKVGPGTTIGGNVQLGGEAVTEPGTRIEVHVEDPRLPGKGRLESKPDYDPAAFDPFGWLPKARARAREIFPDAELVEMQAYNVARSGRVSLAVGGRRYPASYMFRSPAASKPPTDAPQGTKVAQYCRVAVEAYGDTVVASVMAMGGCTMPLLRTPRCSLTELWQRAIADGVDANSVAQITLRTTGWFFTDAKDRTHDLKDDCK
jgi:serine/threonine protein kinase